MLIPLPGKYTRVVRAVYTVSTELVSKNFQELAMAQVTEVSQSPPSLSQPRGEADGGTLVTCALLFVMQCISWDPLFPRLFLENQDAPSCQCHN
jgi:hypothetical protein